MGLLDEIRKDARQFTSNSGDFAVPVTFTTPDGSVSKTVNAIASKHHMSIGTDGSVTNSKQAHISVSEAVLVAAGYPVRSGADVDMLSHRIAYTDSAGNAGTYIIEQIHPDETLGLLLITLGQIAS